MSAIPNVKQRYCVEELEKAVSRSAAVSKSLDLKVCEASRSAKDCVESLAIWAID